MFRPQYTAHRVTARSLRLERLEDRSLLSASPTIDLSGLAVDKSRADQTHILVRYRQGHSPVVLPGTTLGQSVDLVPGVYEVNLTEGVTPEAAIAAYLANPHVETAELDYALSVSWTPNDSQLGGQWGLQNKGTTGADIGATAAWNVTTGAFRVPISVMDSGIDYTHPDLYMNIWLNQKEIPTSRLANLMDIDRDGIITFRDLNNRINQGKGKITDLNKNGFIDGGDLLKPMVKDARGKDTGDGGWADGVSQDGDKYVDDLIGWNSNKNTNDPMDDFGHGTHVAGTIGAMGNNGVGVSGVHWQAQLAGVKFFNNKGAGSILMFIAGLDWALAKGIKVSNNSWNDSGYTSILFDAVKRAQSKGHIFVAAAGNQGRDTDKSPAYPAGFNLDNVVSVGAIDPNGRMASYSNYGKTSVDIVAPGTNVLSTNPNKGYGGRSGTSMATPFVTGVIAQVWGLRPEWTATQVINWVLSTAKRSSALDGKVATGLLNAAAAVNVPPRNATQPPTTRLTSFPAAVASGGTPAAAASTTRPSDWASPFNFAQDAGLLVSLHEGKKERDEFFYQEVVSPN